MSIGRWGLLSEYKKKQAPYLVANRVTGCCMLKFLLLGAKSSFKINVRFINDIIRVKLTRK